MSRPVDEGMLIAGGAFFIIALLLVLVLQNLSMNTLRRQIADLEYSQARLRDRLDDMVEQQVSRGGP